MSHSRHFLYDQSNGKFWNEDGRKLLGIGYSGVKGIHQNNPDSENLKSIGPIPRGAYEIYGYNADPDGKDGFGPNYFRLRPDNRTEARILALGREPQTFLIHEDDGFGTGSQGCICIGLPVRLFIKNGDLLWVVAPPASTAADAPQSNDCFIWIGLFIALICAMALGVWFRGQIGQCSPTTSENLSQTGTSGFEIVHINAFTEDRFSGNPAAVVMVTDDSLFGKHEWMSRLASELAKPVSVFVRINPPAANAAPAHNKIRWFTPHQEIEFCGHGTLAAAFALTRLNGDKMLFESGRTGAVTPAVRLSNDRIQLTVPIVAIRTASNVQPIPEKLCDALGLLGSKPLTYIVTDNWVLLRVSTASELRAVTPDYDALIQLISATKGVIITAELSDRESKDADFGSRVFFLDERKEDFVCAGAHQLLASYWSERLNKTSLTGYQASARPGFVSIQVISSTHINISGGAVAV